MDLSPSRTAMDTDFNQKIANLIAGLAGGVIAPVRMIARLPR